MLELTLILEIRIITQHCVICIISVCLTARDDQHHHIIKTIVMMVIKFLLENKADSNESDLFDERACLVWFACIVVDLV